jgi:hypothetical protein
MSLFVGIGLALMSAAVAAFIKLDRRTFYTTVLILVATYYVLFAVMAGSTRAMMLESLVMMAFLVLAAVGFRTSPWVIAVGLCAHGLLDVGHERIVTNPGVPVWWPSFCAAYDVVAAGVLAWLTARSRPLPGDAAA